MPAAQSGRQLDEALPAAQEGWKRNPDVMKRFDDVEASMGYSVPPPQAFNLPEIPWTPRIITSQKDFTRIANLYEKIQKAAVDGNVENVQRALRELAGMQDIPAEVMQRTIGEIMKRFAY